MSIFKDTFIVEVQNQLRARQDAILKRDSTSIKYLNSRNAWIRMSSSVNIVTPDALEGSSNLAQKYILQGGILKPDGDLRSGVGGINNAYSNKSPDGATHQRGIRPMPGINSIDIKSKSAYGSLREVIVKFQCWDITQLEDLELLYMRPGYTVLIEWGWAPYLNINDKKVVNIENNIIPYDFFKKGKSKEDIWKELFDKSKISGGNYDAMFGYVKNYSWSAREDGGYDCSTTIISIGEIIESLKVNYTPLTIKLEEGKQGLLFKKVTKAVTDRYKKNILAGIFAELYEKVKESNNNATEDGNIFTLQNYNFFIRKLEMKTSEDNDPEKLVGADSNKNQIYITLNSLTEILNKKVILSDKNSNQPMVELSTYEREYDKTPPSKKLLLCLGHPLQVSVDPTICLIGNETWTKLPDQKETKATETQTVVTAPGQGGVVASFNVTKTTFDNKTTKYLGNIPSYYQDSATKELGIIGNIYINLQFLYALSLDNNVESQDKKEKQEISLYDFIKNIMSQVSNCIGNINNFDIHVDPIDSKARIIDINYVNEIDKIDVSSEKNTFILEMHNTLSTVRSYKLESQIFQEQSSIVAIGAQVQGGALGTDSNTMNGFNRGIIDRIIPRKEDPTTIQGNEEQVRTEQLNNLKDNLNTIYEFFGDTTSDYIFWSKASYDAARAGEYKGALRDLIAGFISLSDISSKYNAIIPTKLSIEMDGIGGLVIGHMFKIKDELLPKGYKNIGEKLGAKLGYIVTGIGHSVSNSDWITNIDAQTIILDNPRKNIDGKEIKIEEFIRLINTVPPQRSLIRELTGDGVSDNFKLINDNTTVNEAIKNTYTPALNKAIPSSPVGRKLLLTAQATHEGFKPGHINYDLKNPGNFRQGVGGVRPVGRGKGNATREGFAEFRTFEDGILASSRQLDIILAGKSKNYPKNPTLFQYISKYAPASDNNDVSRYVNFIINYFKNNGKFITKDTLLETIINIK